MEAENKGDSHQRSSFLPSAQFGGYYLTGYQADEAKKINMRTNDRRSVSISVKFRLWIGIMGVYQVASMLMLLLGIFYNLPIWLMFNIFPLINYEFENLLRQMEFLWPLNMKTA